MECLLLGSNQSAKTSRVDMNMENQKLTSDVEAEENRALASRQKRRKLVQGAVVAPVLLISGRSALATGGSGCALSPMAWMSLHPKQNQNATLSHTVGCNTLGLSPGFWTPNKNGKTFQALPNGGTPWASAGLQAFQKLVFKNKKGITVTKNWAAGSVLNYSGLPYNDENNQDVGWNSGSKLPFGNQSRSISRILIEDSASNGIWWHVCAAYLNAKSITGYALTEDELRILATTGKLTNTGYVLSESEIKSFLDQTWNPL